MTMGTLPSTQAAAEQFYQKEALPPEQQSLLDKFQFSINDFLAAINSLRYRAQYALKDPALKAEYDTLMRRASVIQSTINTAKEAINKVTSFFNFSGLGEMGVLPLLPIALITGAVAAIAKWTTDAYALSKRLDEVKRLEGEGIPPEKAAAIVAKATVTPIFGGFTGLVPILAIGGFLLWAYKNKPKIL